MNENHTVGVLMGVGHAGYVSEESKKRFTITAGLLGALFLVIQFAAPFVIMLIMMPPFMMGFDGIERAHVDEATFWNGSMWYTQDTFKSRSEKRVKLLRWAVDAESKPEIVGEIPLEEPYLLATEEGIWVITSDSVGIWTDSVYKEKLQDAGLGRISRPFLMNPLDTQPSVLVKNPTGWKWMKFVDNQWTEQKRMLIPYPAQMANSEPEIRIIADLLSPGHRLVMQYGNTLYASTLSSENDELNWKAMGETSGSWDAVSIGTHLYFAHNGKLTTFPVKTWENPIDLGSFGSGVKLALSEENQLVVLTAAFAGTVRLRMFMDQEELLNKREGSGSPFPDGILALMFIPHLISYGMPFLLALILSFQMRQHRVTVHEYEGNKREYASIIRRGLAMLVDSVIVAFPFLFLFGWMFSTILDVENMSGAGDSLFFLMFGLMFGGLGWAFLVFLIFSFTEGRWGITPGKWLAGIRVLGTDLVPCGFGRAIVRNLLQVIDGFFSFMVGVMVVAFTENWQRLGDMAARTVVVRKRDF